MTYLDANAAEPLRPAARAAVAAALEETGNPASVHAAGRAARRILEGARERIAARFGGRPAELIFVSGGTEADALALHAFGAGRRIIIGATEHDAIRAAAPEATRLPVDRNGIADLECLARLLGEGPPALVALMLANNETGVLHPIEEAAAIGRRFGAFLHVDAVAAAGRGGIDFARLGATSLAISSHKLGGPAGAGALLIAPGAAEHFRPLIEGGGQERGRRGGTPPVAVIAGFAAAAAEETLALACLRDQAERAAVGAGAIVCGGGAPRLSNTTSLALPGIKAETQVMALDLAGVAVSAGAACSSGKVSESHVLRAMGLGKLAGEAIRVSLPWNATGADIEHFASAYQGMARRLLRPAA